MANGFSGGQCSCTAENSAHENAPSRKRNLWLSLRALLLLSFRLQLMSAKAMGAERMERILIADKF